MAETMEAIRYSDSVTIRAHAGTNSFVQAKARELGSKPAEITRQALLAGLRGLGFDPAAIPARDAGALYDSLSGQKRYALVTPAGAILSMSYHDAEPLPDPQDRGVWLPVVHEDSEPFDIATHWRMAPVTTIEPERVVVTFPVVSKTLEAM